MTKPCESCYTFETYQKELKELKKNFPRLKTEEIGKSFWGRPIECLKIGSGKSRIFYSGAHHGMEHLTSALLMRFAGEYLSAVEKGGKIGSYNAKSLAKKSTLYIVPMVNPDGVDLSVFGTKSCGITNRAYLEKINPDGDFSNWQANARGVDLNHNYDALWQLSKDSEKENGITGPGPTRFSGDAPFSEPETKAIRDFTIKESFGMVIAFHSQGKVIYYDFCGKEPIYSLAIAKAFEDISCYKTDYTEGMASYGGYKDWFIDKFLRAGFTVEIGNGKNPLYLYQLDEIYKETLPILTAALNINLPE